MSALAVVEEATDEIIPLKVRKVEVPRVEIVTDDPLTRSGILAHFSACGVAVVEDAADAEVVVFVTRSVDEAAARFIREVRRGRHLPLVLIAGEVDDRTLLAAVEAGASAILRQSEATADRLRDAVHAARQGDGTMPPDLLGRLMSHVTALHDRVLHPNGMHLHGMTDREIEVLRFVAEGWATSAIAKELAYSERTIKNVLHDLTTRLQLKNRSHAVAYAVRHGLI